MIIINISFNVFLVTFVLPVKPDRLFCIVTDYELTDPGFDSGQGKNFLFFPIRPTRLWGQPCIPRTVCVGAKKLGRGINHLPLSSDDFVVIIIIIVVVVVIISVAVIVRGQIY